MPFYILTYCVFSGPVGNVIDPPFFVRGDANLDARVDISDAIKILQALFLDNTERLEDCLDAGDTNDDGGINISDAIYLLNYLFSEGPKPPPPFPDTGTDPTEDQLFCNG